MPFLRFAAFALLALPVAAAAQDYNAAFVGHVWANDASNPGPYVPAPLTSYNAAGGGISITRPSTGTYTVLFAGLASAATGSTVQVTPFIDASTRCAVAGWAASAENLRVSVRCFAAGTGDLTDARFTLLVTKSPGGTPGLGYALADNPTATIYGANPTYSYNGSGGAVSVLRSALGAYQVRFGGLEGLAEGGTVQVSAYLQDTGTRATCVSQDWGPAGTNLVVNVHCFDAAGMPVDYRFTVLFIPSGTATTGLGFAWADDPSNPGPYAPNAAFRHNWSGGDIGISRTAVGSYRATFDNLGGSGTAGIVLVTGYGRTDGQEVACRTNGWDSTPVFQADVRCETPNGTPVDARFTVLAVQPGLMPVASEDGPGATDGLVLEPPAPMPARTETRLTYALAHAATVRLTVYDALGREVARPVEGAMAAGRHTVPFGTASLPAGVYVVRLEGDGHAATRRLVVAR